MGVIKEGLHDTSWENDEGDKITLIDLLNATEDIPVSDISVEELKPHLLSWGGDEDEIKKIESADLQYPILIFVNDNGEFITIIDGHHRAQKAARQGLETIRAKIISINSLPKHIRRVFNHLGKQEQNESELSEDNKTSKIQTMIDNMGIVPTIKFFGGYDYLTDVYGNDVFTKESKINFIKEFYLENEGRETSLYFGDFDISPIHFYEDKKVEKQIEFIEEDGVFVDVYSKTNFNVWMEVYKVPYEELPEDVLDEIFSILINKSY
jgi:hypothetical protein